jgi:hypothetical protein
MGVSGSLRYAEKACTDIIPRKGVEETHAKSRGTEPTTVERVASYLSLTKRADGP